MVAASESGHDVRRFRECLDPLEVTALAERVKSWGYPRALDPTIDIEHGFWFTWGPDLVLWYVWGDTHVLLVHLCVAPESRGCIYPRRFLVGMEVMAEALGAHQLQFHPTGNPESDAQTTDLLRRLHWQPMLDCPGWMLDLRGDS